MANHDHRHIIVASGVYRGRDKCTCRTIGISEKHIHHFIFAEHISETIRAKQDYVTL